MNVFSTYFSSSSSIVLAVVLILLIASIVSWALILKKALIITKVAWSDRRLWRQFRQNQPWSQLYASIATRRGTSRGLAAIFKKVYEEYEMLREQGDLSYNRLKRRVKLTSSEQVERLEHGLSYLATLGSTAPYIGLFGTVWGIMRAFKSLGDVQQVTIAMLAPGISEALVATAMGLFAAIPAVIFYNRLINQCDQQQHLYQMFEEEFLLSLAENQRVDSAED